MLNCDFTKHLTAFLKINFFKSYFLKSQTQTDPANPNGPLIASMILIKLIASMILIKLIADYSCVSKKPKR
jgi:hypothetical protein